MITVLAFPISTPPWLFCGVWTTESENSVGSFGYWKVKPMLPFQLPAEGTSADRKKPHSKKNPEKMPSFPHYFPTKSKGVATLWLTGYTLACPLGLRQIQSEQRHIHPHPNRVDVQDDHHHNASKQLSKNQWIMSPCFRFLISAPVYRLAD